MYIQIKLHGTSQPSKTLPPKAPEAASALPFEGDPEATKYYTQMEWRMDWNRPTCHQRVINGSSHVMVSSTCFVKHSSWFSLLSTPHLDRSRSGGWKDMLLPMQHQSARCQHPNPPHEDLSTVAKHRSTHLQQLKQVVSPVRPVRLAAPTRCLLICLYVHIVILSLCVCVLYIICLYAICWRKWHQHVEFQVRFRFHHVTTQPKPYQNFNVSIFHSTYFGMTIFWNWCAIQADGNGTHHGQECPRSATLFSCLFWTPWLDISRWDNFRSPKRCLQKCTKGITT